MQSMQKTKTAGSLIEHSRRVVVVFLRCEKAGTGFFQRRRTSCASLTALLTTVAPGTRRVEEVVSTVAALLLFETEVSGSCESPVRDSLGR